MRAGFLFAGLVGTLPGLMQ